MVDYYSLNPNQSYAAPESIADIYGNVDLGDLPAQMIEQQRKRSAEQNMAATMRAMEVANRNRAAAGLPIEGQMAPSIFRDADVKRRMVDWGQSQYPSELKSMVDYGIKRKEAFGGDYYEVNSPAPDETRPVYLSDENPSQSGDFLTGLVGGAQSPSALPSVQRESKIMPMAASFQEELPAGQAAEAQSKDALSQLIAQQQKRLAGDPERDRRMMWMNFFANMTGNHANLGDAIAAGAGSIPKTLAEQDAANDKRADSSLASQIEIEKFKRGEMLKQQELANSSRLVDAQSNYYNSRSDVLENPIPKISNRDEMRMMKSEEGAQAAQGVEQLASQAQAILKRYETNKAAPIVGKFGQIANAIGLAGDETKKKIKDYESLDKISSELAIKTLAQFGGNDTDKELKISMETNVDPNALVETNEETLKRKIAAAQILQQKPDFEAQWVAKTGGLNRLDPQTGQSFGAAWLRHQKESWRNALSPEDTGVMPTDDSGASTAPKVIRYDATGKRVQ